MRRQLAALLLALLPASATAQDLSAEIAVRGIAATRDRLAGLAAPTDAERFALGGLHFLGAVESALQLRWRVQVLPQIDMLPVLRLPVPDNPAPEPFRPAMARDLMQGIEAGMARASAELRRIPESSDFGLRLRPDDLWFDIDGNGTRGEREGFFPVAGGVLFARSGWDGAEQASLAIRFDVADSRWLAAYAELVRGVSLAILAYDPTDAIAGVMDTRAGLARLNEGTEMANALDMMVGHWSDTAAAVLEALRRQPDRERAAAALAAFESVVGLNRDFWRLAMAETDDVAEWIPSDSQQSAMGLAFPQGTGAAWLAVLDDAGALLKGDLLLPYWRLGEGVGLDLRQMFLDPRPIDLAAWIQGAAVLPYARRGKRIDAASLNRFNDLVEGRGLLFAAIVN